MSRYGTRLHVYCWMTNHIHMVLQCADIPIFKTLHLAAGAYARTFNAKYAHVGHLFQDRYSSRLVNTDAYLLQLIKYIHVNPVKAGIVAAPIEYRWSSYRSYAFALEPDWLSTGFVLALFGDDPVAARAQMVAFTNAPQLERPHASSTNASDLDELGRWACAQFAIDPSLLTGPSRHRTVTKARAWIVWMAQRDGIATLADVARYFDRQPSVLSRCLARYKSEFEGSSPK